MVIGDWKLEGRFLNGARVNARKKWGRGLENPKQKRPVRFSRDAIVRSSLKNLTGLGNGGLKI